MKIPAHIIQSMIHYLYAEGCPPHQPWSWFKGFVDHFHARGYVVHELCPDGLWAIVFVEYKARIYYDDDTGTWNYEAWKGGEPT